MKADETVPGSTTAPSNDRKPFVPESLDLKQAQLLFWEVSQIASNADRMCYHVHGELVGEGVDQEFIEIELIRLREVIQRLGWLGDLGYSKLTGVTSNIKGGAEQWLLPPVYNEAAEPEVSHG